MEIEIIKKFESLLPRLSDEEFNGLKESIISDGCREPLIVWGNVLIDGHNRYKICTELGIYFRVKRINFKTEEQAADWIDANQLSRRNLTPDAFRLALGRRYNRTKKAEGRPEGILGKSYPVSRTSETLATEHGVSEKTVRNAGKYATEAEADPELMKAIIERTPTKEVKKKKRAKKLEEIKKKIIEEKKVEGKFDVVILDPPWKYGREYDPDSSRVACPYPEQDAEEIFNTSKGFFKDDCVLWLWTTHQFIWDAKELIERWGFTYKATLVWDKEKIGMGSWLRMQCEFCLLAVKGRPYFHNTTERDIIRSTRREHSRKPVEFYSLVKKTCAGNMFEYYSREKKEGIITGGVENGLLG
jgi:N6-adenosine-specific RNA methylase IME4